MKKESLMKTQRKLAKLRKWENKIIGNDLYVGGEITTAGGIILNKIAKWECVNPTPELTPVPAR